MFMSVFTCTPYQQADALVSTVAASSNAACNAASNAASNAA